MPQIDLSNSEFRILMDAMEAYLIVAKSVLRMEPEDFRTLKVKLEEALDDAK